MAKSKTRATQSKRASKPRSRTRDLGPARDFLGYGANPPDARWPGKARIAINFNLNVEAGGEHSILEGDTHSENLLTDIGFPAYKGKRSPMVESVFEYGPRVGCWRLLRIFKQFDVKMSVLGVVRGMQMYPELTRAFVEQGHEVISHGWRWIDYHHMGEKEEREHIKLAVAGIKKLTGTPPVGWFNGRSSVNTRRLLVEQGGFSMTAIISATSYPSGRSSGRRTIWSSPIRWRPTTTGSIRTPVSPRPTNLRNT